MTIFFYFVLTLHVISCLFLIAVVLLQQGKGQDLASAFGGGPSQTAFGPRGSANILSRATTILAGLFMVTSLGLTVVRPRGGGFLDQTPAGAPPAAAVPLGKAPAAGPASSAPVSSVPAAGAPASAPASAPAKNAPASSAPAKK
jgi:preprotein translocase subunit SecG